MWLHVKALKGVSKLVIVRCVFPVGELGKILSPSKLQRSCDSCEFGDISKIESSGVFCLENSEERGLNFHEM
jgi:hypothetical protein